MAPAAAPAASATSGKRLPVGTVTSAKPARNAATERCSSPGASHFRPAVSSSSSTAWRSRSSSSARRARRPRNWLAASISNGRARAGDTVRGGSFFTSRRTVTARARRSRPAVSSV